MSAGAVKGEHELRPSSFAQRRIGDSGLEFADDLGRATCREQCIARSSTTRHDPRSSGSSRMLRAANRAVRGFRAKAPVPPRSGPPLGWCRRSCGVTAPPGGQLVAGGVNLGRGEGPARAFGQREAVAQRATQRGDVGLRALSAVRGGSSPQSNSTRVSAETTEPLCSPSIVRMARGLAPGIVTGEPPAGPGEVPKPPAPPMEA